MSQIKKLVDRATIAINQALDLATLEAIRIEFLGKKGLLTSQIKTLREIPSTQRSVIGLTINNAKQQIQKCLKVRKFLLEQIKLNSQLVSETIDVSLPGRRIENGGLHPITRTINRIEYLFINLGFSVVTGPEVEDDDHNFNALNIPIHHPARTEHDTFWFDNSRLLRTQTSSVQIRIMKNQKPPIRIIAPGRVYRNDYDQTHSPMFHQMEGLIIDNNINFANLKNTLYDFVNIFFEKKMEIRLRASYFPFTNISAEVDVINRDNKWLEVLGCGMVHPNVLRNVGIDPEFYSGFAFGIGIERLAMLRYHVTDLRVFFENDLRFLKQFK
ncbi:phenylalanine--tRNA ligase subunit alpha [Pantoea sp. Aalb]|uniref:phenylalanine--tRNA ligase subunit alpha n=1 Tax=Pantoea sp. Aalb TaxID=2576762 RepID=UPI001327DD8B|nr:phenylalanine--tRNA ligase subunit alpha [Pantoea sp. Aalb]MXP67434.1 phenylalanine--tRNA ligase subunit alpha [Pantoea sp. Aalb]